MAGEHTVPETRSGIALALWQAVWRYRKRTALAVLLLLAAKGAGVAVPWLLKAIVDRFSRPASLVETSSMPGTAAVLVLPVFLLLAYALLRFAGTLFTELRDLVFTPVAQRAVASFAERTLAHLLVLGPRFHGQRSTGALVREVDRGTAAVGFLLGAGLFTAVPTLVEFVAILTVMALSYSAGFILIILLTFLAYATLTGLLTRRRAERQRSVNEVDARASARLVDSLLNYETVKVYARESFEAEGYRQLCEQRVLAGVSSQRALSTLHIGQGAVIAAGVAAMMLLAGEQTVHGRLTVGDLVLVNAYVIQVCLPLNTLGVVFREARDALINAEALLKLLGQRPEIVEEGPREPLRLEGAEVRFEHVDFGYEPGRPVLRDINLRIAPGATLAVVGGSGSGKSTLARLLLRLYDVQGGRITIDGQDLRKLSSLSLREAIGVVPQDTALFNASVAYNIAYGRPGAGMAEIIEAAKAAQVHEFVMSLAQQYDTPVGERGTRLSGGEKQRISIARAFLKNPPLLVFDEATSALDTRAERAIQQELDGISAGRTTLVIAHRLSTVVNADEIIVLDKGRIVEQGRHEDLLALNGLYAQLWELQRQQQQLDRLERQLARQPINLAVLTAHVLDGMRETLEQRRVELFTEIDAQAAGVSGDPTALSHVIAELCRRALFATPDGGRVELRLERSDGHASLSITDGRRAHLAPPQLNGESREMPPPDPLALRSTVERQGGQMLVEAPTALRGMRFTLRLPLRAVADTSGPRLGALPRQVLVPQALSGLRLMCIDDDDDARNSLAQLLRQAGAEVLAMDSGHAATEWLDAHAASAWPQVLICDIVLDDEDGYAVMQRVRRLEAQRGIGLEQRLPAVALTGLAQPGDRIRALMAGFQVHLSKPVDPDELRSTIYSLVGHAGAIGGDEGGT